MIELLVEEQYENTVQGEGYHAGLPCDFIRLYGCPVGCYFCDQYYSSPEEIKEKEYTTKSLTEIVNQVNSKHVVVTGGEPLLNKHIKDLIKALITENHIVHVETSGIKYVDLPPEVWITLSPKEHLNKKYPVTEKCWDRADEIKLIIEEKEDYSFYQDKLKTLGSHIPVYFQPQWYEEKKAIAIILDLLKSCPDYKISLQLHKYLNLL